MNLVIRLILMVVASFFRRRVGALEESVVSFRCYPNDLDFNFHMNNGRYLTIMDLGRIDYLVRSGLWGACYRNKWNPVLAGSTIRYRRALKLFQKFELKTRVLWWDDKWAYLEQRFVSKGRVVAYGMVKAVFIGKNGAVRIEEVMNSLNADVKKPAVIPEAVQHWRELERTQDVESMKAREAKQE